MALAGCPQADQLVALFNQTFLSTENTLLEGGAEEPFYLPVLGTHLLRSDYPRSALMKSPTGVWRRPPPADGGLRLLVQPRRAQRCRSVSIFCCGSEAPSTGSSVLRRVWHRLCTRVDNVECEVDIQLLTAFEQRITHWRQTYERSGLPPRAERFAAVLKRAFEASALRGKEPAVFSAERVAQ